MHSLMDRTILFNNLKLSILIKSIITKIENKEKLTENDKKIINDGIELISGFIRTAVFLENLENQKINKFNFPSFEEIDLIDYIFPVIKGFSKEKNLIHFLLRRQEDLIAIQNGEKENFDELKKFFLGFEKETRKAFMAYEYINDDDE